MIKILLQLLPILVPFVVYIIWARISHGRDMTETKGPWVTLSAVGAVLAVVLMIGMRVALQGADPSGTYVAPHMKDGKLVPGHVISAPTE